MLKNLTLAILAIGSVSVIVLATKPLSPLGHVMRRVKMAGQVH